MRCVLKSCDILGRIPPILPRRLASVLFLLPHPRSPGKVDGLPRRFSRRSYLPRPKEDSNFSVLRIGPAYISESFPPRRGRQIERQSSSESSFFWRIFWKLRPLELGRLSNPHLRPFQVLLERRLVSNLSSSQAMSSRSLTTSHVPLEIWFMALFETSPDEGW